ncbi:epoxyqueuosine reductase [Bacteroidia bacterium]|nr:epoxyqueuosine reductase [Bacteroidia bacterium]
MIPSAADIVKQLSHQHGFIACGIAHAEPLVDEQSHLEYYLSKGFHADMTYLEHNIERRLNPLLLLENAQSVIVVLYPQPTAQHLPDVPKIARFASGENYHHVIKTKLNNVINSLAEYYPAMQSKLFVDTGAIMEKTWAIRAGLGWRGKNSLLIHPEYGSFVNIGIILTDLVLPPDIPLAERCGACTHCLCACPNKAIPQPYYLNAHRCIAYQTICKHLDPTVELHGWGHGCDLCQEVCPWNNLN